jgi:hypothetical protein
LLEKEQTDTNKKQSMLKKEQIDINKKQSMPGEEQSMMFLIQAFS